MDRQRLTTILVAGALTLLVITAVSLFAGSGMNPSGQAQEPSPILSYPEFPPTPTIAPQPTQPARPAAVPLASADFATEAALADWEFVDLVMLPPNSEAVWVIDEGRLLQNRTAAAGNPGTHEVLAVTGEADWSDYTVTTSFYDQQNVAAGVIARRDGDSFYLFRVMADELEGGPKMVLEKVIDGEATILAEVASPGYAKRTWNSLALTVAGNSLQARLNGDVVLEATDTALTSGQAGLYTRAIGGIFFDDFNVTTP